MRMLFLILFITTTASSSAQRVVGIDTIISSPAQKVIDSAFIDNYPVREGIVYRYAYKSGVMYVETDGVVIRTANDSVFHFECAEVAAVFRMDSYSGIVIKNAMNEYFAYSNFKTVAVKKGEQVNRGSYLGLLAKDELAEKNQLDFFILTGKKTWEPQKIMQYIISNISSGKLETFVVQKL